MTMQDPLADMLTRIRNAQMAGKAVVNMPSAQFKHTHEHRKSVRIRRISQELLNNNDSHELLIN